MNKNLLIVHPHWRYDNEHQTRDAIVAGAASFDDAHTFLLFGGSDGAEYLQRAQLPPQRERSNLGEIPPLFVEKILAGCASLSIIGHTGNYCHLTAFEMMLGGFVRSALSELTIALPAGAISDDNGDTGRPLSLEIQKRSTIAIHAEWFPLRLRQYRSCFDNNLSSIEIATISVFEQYIASAFFRSLSHCALHIEIGGKICGGHKCLGKTLHLALLVTSTTVR